MNAQQGRRKEEEQKEIIRLALRRNQGIRITSGRRLEAMWNELRSQGNDMDLIN
jgi:hypothetical protein